MAHVAFNAVLSKDGLRLVAVLSLSAQQQAWCSSVMSMVFGIVVISDLMLEEDVLDSFPRADAECAAPALR